MLKPITESQNHKYENLRMLKPKEASLKPTTKIESQNFEKINTQY